VRTTAQSTGIFELGKATAQNLRARGENCAADARAPLARYNHFVRESANEPLDTDPSVADEPMADELITDEPIADDGDVLRFRFVASKTQTRRIDQFLTERVTHLSRAGVQRLIDDSLVTVNGKPTKASYKVKAGDAVEMIAPPEPVNELIPEDIPLDIIYEDEHFLALNKQADLIVHPARGRWSGTLVNGLVHYGKKWSTLNGDWRPGILHRLDRNTTGLMLVAKSDEAHWRLARQFENRTIQKTYVAVVHGVPAMLGDVIDMPIGKDRYVREKQAIRKEANGGRPAVTRYRILSILPGPQPNANVTLKQSAYPSDQKLPMPASKFAYVELTPKTGRTHQLRVHMATIRHPMVGDTMYGGRIFQADGFEFARQALHARQISFVHPVTLNQMTLSAPLPQDFKTLLQTLGGAEDSEKPE
jgi:23S rRNA pseudouridine1911/1915/1917 synthase